MEKDHLFIKNVIERIPDIPEDSIVSRTIYADNQIKIILFGFAEGQELSEHTASIPAIIHILDGKARITVDQELFDATAGSWIFMKPNTPHSLFAETPVNMLLYMIERTN